MNTNIIMNTKINTDIKSEDECNDIRDINSLNPYDTLIPLWTERQKYSQVEKLLMRAIHEVNYSQHISNDYLRNEIIFLRNQVNEQQKIIDDMNKLIISHQNILNLKKL